MSHTLELPAADRKALEPIECVHIYYDGMFGDFVNEVLIRVFGGRLIALCGADITNEPELPANAGPECPKCAEIDAENRLEKNG